MITYGIKKGKKVWCSECAPVGIDILTGRRRRRGTTRITAKPRKGTAPTCSRCGERLGHPEDAPEPAPRRKGAKGPKGPTTIWRCFKKGCHEFIAEGLYCEWHELEFIGPQAGARKK